MPRQSAEIKAATGLMALARRYPKGCGCIVILLLLLALVIGAIYLVKLLRERDNAPATPPTTTTTLNSGGGLPNMPNKPRPRNESFRGCPPEGDGGKRGLNLLKNRVDEGDYVPVAFDAILNLSAENDVVERYRGIPVAVEGYLAKARLQGPESCNCHGTDDDAKDFHIWLTKNAGEDRERSIVVEPSPVVRAKHPAWTLDNLNRFVKNRQRVRISGWLLLDPEHPDQIGKTRGTIWEVHPVMKIEVQQGGAWVNLDNWQ